VSRGPSYVTPNAHTFVRDSRFECTRKPGAAVYLSSPRWRADIAISCTAQRSKCRDAPALLLLLLLVEVGPTSPWHISIVPILSKPQSDHGFPWKLARHTPPQHPGSMLWQLPASVRSLALSTCRRYGVTTPTHTQAPEPLRILFCGSDDFSIASLRALTAAKHDLPSLIHSIHVVHRPAKPTGRGLKTLREGTYLARFIPLYLWPSKTRPLTNTSTHKTHSHRRAQAGHPCH
jgi:hypothetical protein